jgi:guanylate kinase
MEKAIERGEFVEYAKVHTNMYGTSVKAVQSVSIF